MRNGLHLACALFATSWSVAATAEETPPVLAISGQNTTDLWDVPSGGLRRGDAVLNKLQLEATFAGDRIGLKGLSIHLQAFRLDGERLGTLVGDVQLADSIDARPVTRLFESWIEEKLGDEDRSFALRAGLIDLNGDFDSLSVPDLFVNSSHGIGADLGRSGSRGPSVYPVSSLGVQASWLPSKTWSLRIAAFDGVSGDPGHPAAFVSARLRASDGALLIGQVDYHLSDQAKVEAGAWRYTVTDTPLTTMTGRRGALDQGAYVSIEGPLPRLDKLSGWLRAGVDDGEAQTIDSYLGAGLVREGLLSGREHDRIGIAIARAGISSLAQRTYRLHSAETSYELTYQCRLGKAVEIQPDLQYIEHPAADARARSALALGLRLVLSAGYPAPPSQDAAR